MTALGAILPLGMLRSQTANADDDHAEHGHDHKPVALIDGEGHGWKALGPDDFERANCDPDTWSWKEGVLHCTGKPVGVIKSKKMYTNFELVVEWMHEKPAGNSGVFVWTIPDSLAGLKPNALPQGIEVQVLDNDFAKQYEKNSGKKGDWFTTHGDVFKVGKAKLTPFPPLSPDGSRSFPRKNLSQGFGKWNHYYIRAINGEIRLWVNGTEVSGGNHADPATGYLCLESEGSPIQFRNIKLRELP